MKFLFKTILILLFTVVSSYSEKIVKFEVFGNQRISNETIKVLGNFDIGQEYEDEKSNDILKNLYNSNFFKDVKIIFQSGNLTINVEENPIIENIEVNGIRSDRLLKFIQENLTLKNRSSFSNSVLKNDLIKIDNILKINGYYFSSTDVFTTLNEKLNSININIKIDLGSKAKIRDIQFTGNKNIKDKKLLEVIVSEKHQFWKFISNNIYVNQSNIDLDVRLLENYYKNLGFYDVKVNSSFVEFNNKKNSFKLTYNINSGTKYFFNNFTLNLPDDYDSKDFKNIYKIFDDLKDKKYSINSIDLILSEIEKIAASRLYDFLDADVVVSTKNDKIDFTFNVNDSLKFYVQKINILGNFNTIEEVIRNQLEVDEGDPLNDLLYNKTLNNIRSLGIFKNVNGVITDGDEESKKIIDISVEEQPTGEISLAAGVGTSGSTIGGGVRERNFLGKGINLSTNLELSEDGIKGKFNYSKPNFAYTDNTLFTSLESSTKDLLSDYGYKQSNLGFSIGTKFEQYENLYFSPEIDFNIEDLKTNSNASSNLKKQEGTYEDFYFKYGLEYDLRDSKYNPSSGINTSFFQELPLVSGNNEIANTFIATKYQTLNDDSQMIGKISFYIKSINSLDNSDVRISKRVNVPYNRLRGFEKGKIGPVDNSDYIGGNYVSTLNLSTNLPSLLRTVENVDFSYFIDFANVWGVDYDSSLDNSNSIRSSTGLGMDILTPIGPLSFSLTQPITKKSSDKTESFRFNLGTTF